MLREIPPGLDPLYDRMMEQILTQNDPQTVQFCQRLLRAVALTYRPLGLRELIVTSGLPGDKFDDIRGLFDLVNRCGSFLSIREDAVFFVHLSAYDYFTLGKGKQVFNGTTMIEHEKITYRLLHSMCHTLRRDICNLKKPGVRIQEARKCISGTALPQIAYACEYWIDHLQASAEGYNDILADNGIVHRFLQKHLLHWLEAMSLVEKMPEALTAMRKLHFMLDVSTPFTEWYFN